jgi:glucosamine--fructose-6-phosphate aminotransferase (isomerizing)
VLDRALVQALLGAGAGRDRLSYRTLKVLADLDPAVEAVVGYTRYAIDGDPATVSGASISIVDRGGLSRDVPSRVERNSQLLGTKRRVASEREVLVARGRGDGRTVILVPEVKGGTCTGITLLHVRFHDRLPAATMRGVLQGYDRRYDRLVDWVSETEGVFRDDLLADLPVADLLILPISDTADHWRSGAAEHPDGHQGDRRRRGRHRAVPHVAGRAHRRCGSGCSPPTNSPTSPRWSTPCARWRRGSRRARR